VAVVDPSSLHEALRAAAGYPKYGAGSLIVAQEKVGRSWCRSLVDQVLGEMCHVDAA
jgi:hypothetical protein